MKRETIHITVLESDPGYVLTNGEVWTRILFLGVADSPENWHEVPEEEVPLDMLPVL